MQLKKIDGWYCVTICGVMSWKFRNIRDGIRWALITKEAREVEAAWTSESERPV